MASDPRSTAVASTRLTEEAIMRLTAHMLRTQPHAAMSAITPDGFFVPMPDGVPLRGQSVIEGHATALEFVVPEDFALVIKAWQDATVHGIAQTHVRPLGTPTETLTINYLDTRAQFGVFLLFVTGNVELIAQRQGDIGAMRPRVATVRKNQQAQFVEVDRAIELILGHQDLVGRRNVELIHPDDQPRAIANWIDMLTHPGSTRRVRLRQQHRDGHWVWFEITNTNRLDDPAEGCVIAEMIDISEEMAAQEFLRVQENLLRRLTDSLPVGVVQIDDDGLIVHRNPRVTEILGHAKATSFDALFAGVDPHDQTAFTAAAAAAAVGTDRDLELGVVRSDGSRVRCHVTLRPLDSQGMIICVEDVTADASLREQLRHRATYDDLTGCHNRTAVWHELELALELLRAGHGGVGVVFVDLDSFKAVNDRDGHAAGDALLARVGACLRNAVRVGSTVGRIGGDEFIVVLTEVETVEEAMASAERIAERLATTVRSEPDSAVASIGVAWTGSLSGADPATALVRQADAAMYASKAEGAGRPFCYENAAETAA